MLQREPCNTTRITRKITQNIITRAAKKTREQLMHAKRRVSMLFADKKDSVLCIPFTEDHRTLTLRRKLQRRHFTYKEDHKTFTLECSAIILSTLHTQSIITSCITKTTPKQAYFVLFFMMLSVAKYERT